MKEDEAKRKCRIEIAERLDSSVFNFYSTDSSLLEQLDKEIGEKKSKDSIRLPEIDYDDALKFLDKTISTDIEALKEDIEALEKIKNAIVFINYIYANELIEIFGAEIAEKICQVLYYDMKDKKYLKEVYRIGDEIFNTEEEAWKAMRKVRSGSFASYWLKTEMLEFKTGEDLINQIESDPTFYRIVSIEECKKTGDTKLFYKANCMFLS